MPVTPSVDEFLHLYFILHTFTGNLSQKNTRNIFKKKNKDANRLSSLFNTIPLERHLMLNWWSVSFSCYIFSFHNWPLWFLRNFYTSGSQFVVCRMNCWRRVNEIQLRRVVLYKVNTQKKNVYFISKGPPKYNFIEIKRSKDQGFQIYLTVSMMTKVNELGTNIYKQVVYYQ